MLLPLEDAVLETTVRRLHSGDQEVHGFDLARELDDGRSTLTAHGTLYKVLERLEVNGLLTSRWETDEEYPGGRPRRRLYRATPQAQLALARSRELLAPQAQGRLGLAPT